MAVAVKKIKLWRVEVENKPGVLAAALEPLAGAGADLQIVMGYRIPGTENKAAIEVFPVSGKKSKDAAGKAGLAESAIPTLLVEGDNKPGLGHTVAQAIAAAGINIAFFIAQVVGRRYSAVVGFESDPDARKASAIIKKVTAPRRAAKKAARRK